MFGLRKLSDERRIFRFYWKTGPTVPRPGDAPGARAKAGVLAMYIRRGKIPLGDVVHEWNGIRFVWNREKAESNLRKHGVSFEAACEVFFDPFVRLLDTSVIGGEGRERTIGLTEDWRLVVVVCTFRKEHIRIISARPATLGERTAYEEETAP